MFRVFRGFLLDNSFWSVVFFGSGERRVSLCVCCFGFVGSVNARAGIAGIAEIEILGFGPISAFVQDWLGVGT